MTRERYEALLKKVETKAEKINKKYAWLNDFKESFTLNTTTLTKKQQQVFKDNRDFILLSGGVGSGKTYTMAYKLISYCINNKGKKINITGKTYSSAYNNIILQIKEILREQGYNWKAKEEKGKIVDLFGNKLRIVGTSNKRSWEPIRGDNVSVWYANEINTHDKEAVEEAFRRTRISPRRIWWDTNPDSPNHWVFTEYINEKTRRREPIIYNSTPYDNKENLDENYIKDLEKAYKGTYLEKRYLEGQWVDGDEAPLRKLTKTDYALNGTIIAVIDPSLKGVDYTALSIGCIFNEKNNHKRLFV